MGFSYIIARQQGKVGVAKQILDHPSWRDNPSQLSNFLGQHEIPTPSIKCQSRRIYEDILVYLLKLGHNPIHDDLMEIYHQHNRADIEFMVCSSSKDMVWSCGSRETVIQKLMGRGEDVSLLGFNLYGEALLYAYLQINAASFHFHWPTHDLVCRFVFNCDRFSKFLLLLIDSQGRNVRHIPNSDVVCISGGQYDHIRHALSQHNVRDYKFVIVAAGVNMYRVQASNRDIQWRELLEAIEDVRRRFPHTEVIFSPPFPHPDVSTMKYHMRTVEMDLKSRDIKMVEWENYSHHFINSFGAVIPELFERDNFHVNHVGFRTLWYLWCHYLPALKFLSYTLDQHKLSQPKALYNSPHGSSQYNSPHCSNQ